MCHTQTQIYRGDLSIHRFWYPLVCSSSTQERLCSLTPKLPGAAAVQEAALGELAAIGGSQQLNLPPGPIGLPEPDVVNLKFSLNALAFRGIC